MNRPKIFDDLAGVAGGALSALTGIGEEVEQIVRARIDEALRNMKLVRRDEFDAALELASNARAGQEDAALRIAALERRVAALESGGPETMDGSPLHDHEEGGLGGPPVADAQGSEAHGSDAGAHAPDLPPAAEHPSAG